MHASQALLLTLALPIAPAAAQTVLGVYIFSRHGDRTSKSTPPTVLTDLGYQQVFTSGTYFRNRYIADGAPSQIAGIEPNVVKYSQISASAPLDTVLMPSAQGFLQGLYPPVGPTLGSQKLANGMTVQSPLNGYQLIPIAQVTTGATSESTGWLQGASNCANAIVNSNEYFSTPEYMSLLNSTADFYKSLTPLVNNTFSPNQISYKNAYIIYDLLNVATIHNSTVLKSPLLPPSTLQQLRTLADTHEYNLAFNQTSPVRAITGATLAAQILQSLNTTIHTSGSPQLTLQLGAYASFESFFGLANLTSTNADFYGIPDYASTMTFELSTNTSSSTTTPIPPPDQINVRFLFHNGTTSNSSEPTAYPLFGQSSLYLPWTTFVASMNAFAVGSQAQWTRVEM
ncbi:Histidine phosphatase superfamily, clade-2 [Lasallia pustulata]|uniref:Histidine phosphatase superfamily, clade-2 n=1 Tax=Lasallia pustulata TaxID=136370 RepID=A0A1W5CY84_9LECA|nr:Histidine phosphatase superfamily, clade-2 [Lasallia pustulata]